MNTIVELKEKWFQLEKAGDHKGAVDLYYDALFEQVIEHFVKKENNGNLTKVDVLFSILGCSPEPIILAAQFLKPTHHIILHDEKMANNENNRRFLDKFLKGDYEMAEFSDESFNGIYGTLKEQMAINAGQTYAINITGGKKSMAACAGIFARDFNNYLLYIDSADYNPDIRRPTPGTENMHIIYSPLENLNIDGQS